MPRSSRRTSDVSETASARGAAPGTGLARAVTGRSRRAVKYENCILNCFVGVILFVLLLS